MTGTAVGARTTPYLSLIVPSYNAAAYIEDSIMRIVGALEVFGRPFEVLVVCDGASDGTAEAARRVSDPRVTVKTYVCNEGKGYAIKTGVAEARGDLIGWLDCDLDIPPEVIVRYAGILAKNNAVDAVVGSKRHPESDVVYPIARRAYSVGYQVLIRLLFRVNCRDTQVGAKVFRRAMLETVVPLLLVKRYAFDLEVLAVGAEMGFDRVLEAPVVIGERFSGTSLDWAAVRAMLVDTLAISYRIHFRHYYARKFASLQRERDDRATSSEAKPGGAGAL